MTTGRITDALRKAIAKDDRTPAKIAWDAGLNPSQIYRFLEGGDLKLSSLDALAELLNGNLVFSKPTSKATRTPARVSR